MTRKTRTISRLAMAALAAVLVIPSQAYYHYIHYANRTGPFVPIYEKYDLTALYAKTLTFFVSDQSPAVYGPNDSFGSVLSQVKQALGAWNGISTSDLRLAFGGLENDNQPAPTTPGGDIIFLDLPPGLLGVGFPTTTNAPVTGPNGTFFPIVHSTVMLSRDTTQGPGPSYLEAFYTTAVHEIGHALGLQHTWTASAMSQDVVRNTSRARPLDADDIAGLSVLYGKSNWTNAYGSISGRVTFANGQPVALASVVAIAMNGPAVSSLTDPNGNYRIDGLPPNLNYLLYVHPLPPDAIPVDNSGLRLPVDLNNVVFPQSGYFQTIFSPSTLDPGLATAIPVVAGAALSGVNLTVQPRSSVPAYDIVTWCRLNTTDRTYVYSGDTTVQPAYIDTRQDQPGLIILRAVSPLSTPLPQTATILGGFGTASQNGVEKAFSLMSYQNPPGSPTAVAVYFSAPLGAGSGQRHLVLNYGDDILVIPDAVTLVKKGPPSISSAAGNQDGSVTLTGAGFGLDSSVYFDGLKATITAPFSGNDAKGTITVTPPTGIDGQVSMLTVYNSDGQNSMILQRQNPQTFAYPTLTAPQITNISLTALPANSSASVDITSSNTSFADGQVTVGFGSDDVTVRRVWVLSPTHLIANVVVAPGAALGSSEISIVSGFQVMARPGAFQTQAARAGLPVVYLPVNNADANQQTIYPGSFATVYGQNLTGPTGTVQATLNDIPVTIQFSSTTQLNINVPAGFPVGLATLKIGNGTASAFPVTVQIDNPPPVIAGVSNLSGVPLFSGFSATSTTVTTGDVLIIQLLGLDPTVATNPSRLRVTLGGVEMPAQSITLPSGGANAQVQVIVTQSFGGSQVPLMVMVDGSSSSPVLITVR